MGEEPAARGSTPSAVRTFLIADVRGYTRFTQGFGDEAAAHLTARFAEIATATVAAHGGEVVETRGDEVLAVFASARSALRASVELQRALRMPPDGGDPLALGVGMGLDSGEAVSLESGYRGAALNLAARLCSVAAPGQVLASEGVVHLAGRMDGIRAAPQRAARLKGLADPVRVVEVTPEEALPPLPLLSLPGTPRRGGTRTRLAAVLGLGAAMATAAVLVTTLRSSEGLAAIAPDAAGVIDVASGEIVGEVPIEGRPGGMAIGLGAVWLADSEHGTLLQVDPESHTVTDDIQVGSNPLGVAVGDNAVWVVNGDDRTVSRVDPSSGREVTTIPVGNGPRDAAFGVGALWVTNATDGTVSRIDPAGSKVAETIALGQTPTGIAVGLGAVWVTSEETGLLIRIDPEDSAVTESLPVGNGPTGVALGAGAVWVANALDHTVSRIDPDDSSVRKIAVDGSPSALAFSSGNLWVASGVTGSVSLIDPESRTVTRSLEVGSSPTALAGGGDRLWVTASPPVGAHRGGTLVVLSRGGEEFDTIDPADAYRERSWQILSMVHNGLVAYRRSGGSIGATIVPDLSANLPVVQDGDRTYLFRLRRGIHYSTGAVVEPGDVRASVERLFLSPNPSGAEIVASAIVGSDACFRRPRECDLSEGIEIDEKDRTIAFHLQAPDPDFLYKLALPFGSVLPSGSPEPDIGTSPLPATGPYMIESYRPDDEVVLERNLAFHEWSAAAQPQGFPDRIVLQLGVDPNAQTTRVASGRADVMLDVPPADRLEEIATRYPARAHAQVRAQGYYLFLNNAIAPFHSLDARRAINLAVDRSSFVRLWGGRRLAQPTCQVLPPNFPGYRPYCPHTRNADPAGAWKGAALGRARALVRDSGTRGARVRVWSYVGDSDFHERAGRAAASALSRLGYRPDLRIFQDIEAYFREVGRSENPPHVGVFGWISDYPAASDFFSKLLTCAADRPERPFNLNLAHFCDPDLERTMSRAQRLQTKTPAVANALWQKVDRAVVDRAVWVPLINPVVIDFLSARTGNYQRHPSPGLGVLLDQLWVE